MSQVSEQSQVIQSEANFSQPAQSIQTGNVQQSSSTQGQQRPTSKGKHSRRQQIQRSSSSTSSLSGPAGVVGTQDISIQFTGNLSGAANVENLRQRVLNHLRQGGPTFSRYPIEFPCFSSHDPNNPQPPQGCQNVFCFFI